MKGYFAPQDLMFINPPLRQPPLKQIHKLLCIIKNYYALPSSKKIVLRSFYHYPKSFFDFLFRFSAIKIGKIPLCYFQLKLHLSQDFYLI